MNWSRIICCLYWGLLYGPVGAQFVSWTKSSGFPLGRNLAVFTRSAISPSKVNRFWWHLEHFKYIVGGWPWQILWAIRAVATVESQAKSCMVFGPVNNVRFRADFRRPNFTKFQHNYVDRRGGKNFRNKILKILPQVVVFPKNAKISHKISKSCDFRPP